MRKYRELTDPDSCISKAKSHEMTFVLLGRDAAAPVAIKAWITERIRIGKNQPGDSQITEAKTCARTMEAERLNPATPDAAKENRKTPCPDPESGRFKVW